MSTKRERYGSTFMAQVAVAAICGVKSTGQLNTEHQVHPTMISQRKPQAVPVAG